MSYGFAAISVVSAVAGGWWGVAVCALCVAGTTSMLPVLVGAHGNAKRALRAATLRELEREFDRVKSKAWPIMVLPPNVSSTPTTQEAGENLLMAFGHEMPLCEPIGPCPRCASVAAHLLGEPKTAGGRRLTTRTCRACGHAWRERLDA